MLGMLGGQAPFPEPTLRSCSFALDIHADLAIDLCTACLVRKRRGARGGGFSLFSRIDTVFVLYVRIQIR